MSGIWVLVLVIGVVGDLLLVHALRDVRDEISRTVDSFTEFRAALAPALVALARRNPRRDPRLEPAPGADATRQ